MEEIWKQYKDTIYYASNTGYIKNITTGKILAPSLTRQGYARFALWHQCKSHTVAVHRVVAEVFLENPESKAIVNHIDGNPKNNRADNLEWATISENVKHAYATGLASRGEDCTVSKLTEKEVLEIIECMRNGYTVSQTAKQFLMSAAAISHIWNGKTWKHLNRELPETKNYKGKLKASDIPVIRELFKTKSNKEIAIMYGIHAASVYNIRNGKNWTNY